MGSTVSTLPASTVLFLALPPGALAANGVDFSNNLFSDLGPVLALFGEQVAKQFLSQSMTWLEDVIFAMAPLGIITAIVSAVRVAGPNWLKAVIGRARESEAVAEMELMSSTSHEVCELWNGQAIVRVMGSPGIVEILYFEDEGRKGKRGLFTLETAIREGMLEKVNKTGKGGSTQTEQNPLTVVTNGGTLGTKRNILSRIFSRTPSKGPSDNMDLASADPENPVEPRSRENPQKAPKPNTLNCAPNVSLNVCEIERGKELWFFAIISFVLQFGSLAFIGVTRYHPRLGLKGEENSRYAYPLMASGTLFLVMGMMACSHVVQASSTETNWKSKTPFWHLWVQRRATVNDQVFGSYLLFAKGERKTIITSRRRERIHSSEPPSSIRNALAAPLSLQNLTIVGSLITLAGFVTQFVGIRALHWSASIAQLAVTLIMTAVRTWIRRNMSLRPEAVVLPASYQFDCLAVELARPMKSLQKLFPEHKCGYGGDGDLGLEVLTLQGYPGYKAAHEAHSSGPNTDTQRIMELRSELEGLKNSEGSSYPPAPELAKCLGSLLSCFATSQAVTLKESFTRSDVFQWTLPVNVKPEIEWIAVTAKRKDLGEDWDVSPSELSAIISLWSYGMSKYEQTLEDTPDKDRSSSDHGHVVPTVLRVLGPAEPLLIRDCEWWMDRGGRFVVVETSELINAKSSGRVTALKTKEPSETIAQKKRRTTENSTSVASHRIVGTKPIIDKESLVFVSEGPLRRMCAQEILSSFMWAIAGAVQSITSETEPRTINPPGVHEREPDGWFNFELENSFFQKLADIITASGVTSNSQDAYALIIPPFSDAGKLPGVSYVVTETHQKIKNLQQVEKPENTTKIKEAYLKLFEILNSSEKTHSATIAVAALLMEELCNLNTAVVLDTDRANLETKAEKARECLDEIKSKLIKEGDKNTLGALIYLYQKQGRGAEGGGIGKLPSDCATEIGDICELGDLGKLEERARWNPAHKWVTDGGGGDISMGVPYLNDTDILGWTPLHYAADKPGDRVDLVSDILDAGGQVDPKTKSDYTPLHYAAAHGHTQVVSKLCRAGADKDAQNIDLRTPLHLAAEGGHHATTMFLLSEGADPRAYDKYDWTPLHFAATRGKINIAKELLAKGAIEDAHEGLGMTPLHMAASTGQSEIVVDLLRGNSEATTPDRTGRTPLHLAASSGNVAVVEILFGRSIDPDVMDHEKNRPLHYAARRGHLDVVNRLLLKVASPKPFNNDCLTPLDFACKHGHEQVVVTLLAAGVNPTLKMPESIKQELREMLEEGNQFGVISLLEKYRKSWSESAGSSTYGASPQTQCPEG